jgi:hypothetical protein
MRKALYFLTAVPVFLTAALILLEVVLLPVAFFWISHEHSSRDVSRDPQSASMRGEEVLLQGDGLEPGAIAC